jgi:hypothetical protein
VRSITSVTALAVAAILTTTSISWAGSDGRKNTALAATALAVGAWSNHTGKAGRKNTAILATAGAALAWGRYGAKRKQESRRNRYLHVASRSAAVPLVVSRTAAVPVVLVTSSAPRPCRGEEYREDHGRHLGWYKHGKHDREHDEHERHCHHHGDGDDD